MWNKKTFIKLTSWTTYEHETWTTYEQLMNNSWTTYEHETWTTHEQLINMKHEQVMNNSWTIHEHETHDLFIPIGKTTSNTQEIVVFLFHSFMVINLCR